MRAVGPISGTLLLDYGDTRILDVMIEGLSRAEAHRSERFAGDSVGDIIRFTQTARTSVAQDCAEMAQRLRNQRVDDCFPRSVARVFWLFGILLGCPKDDRTEVSSDKRAGKPTLFSGRPPGGRGGAPRTQRRRSAITRPIYRAQLQDAHLGGILRYSHKPECP